MLHIHNGVYMCVLPAFSSRISRLDRVAGPRRQVQLHMLRARRLVVVLPGEALLCQVEAQDQLASVRSSGGAVRRLPVFGPTSGCPVGPSTVEVMVRRKWCTAALSEGN